MIDDPDELVSAYLDGQVTAEDAARVESDPELLALVDELRAVTGPLGARPVPPVDPAVRARHLAAALDAFGALDRIGSTQPGGTVEPVAADGEGERPGPRLTAPGYRGRESAALQAARHAHHEPVPSLDELQAARAGRRSGPPVWLRAAAVVAVVGGGVAFAASRFSGVGGVETGSDSAARIEQAPVTTAAAALPGGAKSAGQAVGQAGEQASDQATSGQPTAAAAVPTTAFSPTTASRSAVSSSTAATSPQASTTAGVTSTTRPVTSVTGPVSTLPGSTVTPPAALVYASVPSDATLTTDVGAATWRTSTPGCSGVTAPAGTNLAGWVAVSVGGVPGQALVYRNGAGPITVLLRQSSTCQAF